MIQSGAMSDKPACKGIKAEASLRGGALNHSQHQIATRIAVAMENEGSEKKSKDMGCRLQVAGGVCSQISPPPEKRTNIATFTFNAPLSESQSGPLPDAGEGLLRFVNGPAAGQEGEEG